MRHRTDPPAGRGSVPGEVLPHRDAVHRLRYRDHLPVPLGGHVRPSRTVRPRGNGHVRRNRACRVRLRMAPRRSGMGLAMGVEEKLPSGILLTTVEKLSGYARKSSVWPATFGLACCAIELMSTGGPRHDLA